MVPDLVEHRFMTYDSAGVELRDIKRATMWKAFSLAKVNACKEYEQQLGCTKDTVKILMLEFSTQPIN
jgi:hypothetical protein